MKRMNHSFSLAQTYLLATGVAAAGSMLMLCLISLFLAAADISSGAVPTLSLVSIVTGAFLGGFFAARRVEERGLLTGLIVGAALLVLFLAIGLFVGPVTPALLTKGIAILLGASLGGVFGVNRRRRIRH